MTEAEPLKGWLLGLQGNAFPEVNIALSYALTRMQIKWSYCYTWKRVSCRRSIYLNFSFKILSLSGNAAHKNSAQVHRLQNFSSSTSCCNSSIVTSKPQSPRYGLKPTLQFFFHRLQQTYAWDYCCGRVIEITPRLWTCAKSKPVSSSNFSLYQPQVNHLYRQCNLQAILDIFHLTHACTMNHNNFAIFR